jgi:hypothetical protein
MKKSILWVLAIVITIGAAYYQRKTGPTYPKTVNVNLNDLPYEIKLVRSLGLDEKPEIRLKITDKTINAKLWYKKFKTSDGYTSSDFSYKIYPVNSFVMNKIFRINEVSGLYAEIPQQPPAGKLQYYIELTDSKGTTTILKETPVVIRFKGAVPSYILVPHILFMFVAMLFSTLAGLMAIIKYPLYRKYSVWTLVLFIAGGLILGPIVQKYAFGDLWTGVPFGWDLTDNKTLIAFLFWTLAVIMNRKKERPFYTIVASAVLLLVFSIPHSIFGSELDYSSGEVTQGLILVFLSKISKNS